MPSWYGGITYAEYNTLITRLTRIERKLDHLQLGLDELLADLRSQGVASRVSISLGQPTEKP